MSHYYLIGNPVKHSLSPKIFEFLKKSLQIKFEYKALEIAPQDLIKTLNFFKENKNIKGFSITSPFKFEIFKKCVNSDEYAKAAKSVSNVLILKNREFYGFNLDGFGLFYDLIKYLNLNNKKILILGAGGALFGIIAFFLKKNIKNLSIANRTFEKFNEIKINFRNYDFNFFKLAYIKNQYDLIINTINAELDFENILKNNFHEQTLIYDITYGLNLNLRNFAKKNNLLYQDGKGMLFELNKKIFSEWFNIDYQKINHLKYFF